MKLIVGLGNPGSKYESTKHNVGFLVVDHLLKDIEPVKKSNWDKNEKLKSEVHVLDYKNKLDVTEKIILAKPLTYMNNSGMAVALITNYYKIKPVDVWLIHDEMDLPLGSIKIRLGGSGAGHHGVESVMKSIDTEKFWRFRMGIGITHSHEKMARHNFRGKEFVLKGFRSGEASDARKMVKHGSKALIHALEKGIESAQNNFNTK